MGDKAGWVEGGLVAFALVLLGGLGVLLAGRVAGDARRGRRKSAPPPSRGSVSPERHRAVSTASVR
jgi:hypothetical protein